MPLPTLAAIHNSPATTLPKILHRTRTGGTRAHCSATGLATLVAAGTVTVGWTTISRLSASNLPRRTGSESAQHRLLRSAACALITQIDPHAIVGMEVRVAVGNLVRRLDALAVTGFGSIVAFAGACDGRDLFQLLRHGRADHCLALPFQGLTDTEAMVFAFSNASADRLPTLCLN